MDLWRNSTAPEAFDRAVDDIKTRISFSKKVIGLLLIKFVLWLPARRSRYEHSRAFGRETSHDRAADCAEVAIRRILAVSFARSRLEVWQN
jgi:hypothetical protein